MLDFTNYVFLTTTYSGRVPLAIATLSSVMQNVQNAKFVVQWCDDRGPTFDYLQKMLGMIAYGTGNVVELNDCLVNHLSKPMSVAHTKTSFEFPRHATHFVNLDDDLLITQRSLELLLGLRDIPVVTIGVMDAINARGFADYDETRYQSMEHFLANHPPGKAKHHYFANVDILPDQKWISQLYCLNREVYLDVATWDDIYTRFAEKGVRGYDICLENNLASRNIQINLIVGCEALHIGLEHAYIGGPWKSADSIATTVVETKDGYQVRE